MKKRGESRPDYSQFPPFDVLCKWNGKEVVFTAIHFMLIPPVGITRTWQVEFVADSAETRINDLESAADYEICFRILEKGEVKLYKLTCGLFRALMRGRKWQGRDTKQVHFKFASRDLITATKI